jgi:hypothetical protein
MHDNRSTGLRLLLWTLPGAHSFPSSTALGSSWRSQLFPPFLCRRRELQSTAGTSHGSPTLGSRNGFGFAPRTPRCPSGAPKRQPPPQSQRWHLVTRVARARQPAATAAGASRGQHARHSRTTAVRQPYDGARDRRGAAALSRAGYCMQPAAARPGRRCDG